VPTFPYEASLAEVREIDGFVLACLVDSATGMVLGSTQQGDDMSVPVAAAGATDLTTVLSIMTAELALDGEPEDLIVTLSSHYHLVRLLQPAPGLRFILLVTLDRKRANLGMAHRQVRGFTLDPGPGSDAETQPDPQPAPARS
jgi:hypothetical protein